MKTEEAVKKRVRMLERSNNKAFNKIKRIVEKEYFDHSKYEILKELNKKARENNIIVRELKWVLE